MTTNRITAGVYATWDGWQIRRSVNALDHTVWHLIDPDGEWVQDYALKRYAVDAIDEARRCAQRARPLTDVPFADDDA